MRKSLAKPDLHTPSVGTDPGGVRMDEDQLARASQAAAESLANRGVSAQADGSTIYCAFRDGSRVIVRNSLRPVTRFSGEHLVSQVSNEIVKALVSRRHTDRPDERLGRRAKST